MVDTSKTAAKRARDVYYYRQRFKNRVFAKLVSFFAKEAERSGVTKRDIALRLKRDPASITRWLSSPGNMTLDTISDLLLALDAEIDPGEIVRFADRNKINYAHPLVARTIGAQISNPKLNVQTQVSSTASVAISNISANNISAVNIAPKQFPPVFLNAEIKRPVAANG